MQTRFPSVETETGSPGKIKTTGIQINYQEAGTETDHLPEIVKGGMEGAGLQLRTFPLREGPDLERKGKDPTTQEDLLYKKNC